MKKNHLLFGSIFLLLAITIISCSASNDSSNEDMQATKADSVYVFDEVPVTNAPKDTLVQQPKVTPPKIEITYYVVQIGAFTTKEKAENFMEVAKNLLKHDIEISYSENVKLFVVQLTPPYTTKEEAESVRNELWKMDKFNDAWIVTVKK
ncbi:MAG TPA: SPOR domain-containing protein [Ignavibacteriaceae bacterium]|nr:SPOR domain-containing protein [Ignavibacteriaceae bacterium]